MKRFIAIILCLLFGFLGIHRFYIGYKKSGFLLLLLSLFNFYFICSNNTFFSDIFCLIIFVWWVFDLIMLCLGNMISKIINQIKINKKAKKYAEKINIKITTIKQTSNGKIYAKLEPLTIYSTKKPEIINFISDSDYRVLLNLYSCHTYGSKDDLNKILRPYPYNKYDWNVLLQIVWTYQNYYKNMEKAKKAGVKKVKLECINKCESCKNLDKIIDINKAPEIPIKNCPLEARICIGCFYDSIVKL